MRMQGICFWSMLSATTAHIQAYQTESNDARPVTLVTDTHAGHTSQQTQQGIIDISPRDCTAASAIVSRLRSSRFEHTRARLRRGKGHEDEMFLLLLGLLQEREGQGEPIMVSVYETTTDMPSSVGTLTQKCMTLADDPTQTFCETLLNGESIGSDSGLGALPIASPSLAGPESSSTQVRSSSTSAQAITTIHFSSAIFSFESPPTLTLTSTITVPSISTTSTAASQIASVSSQPLIGAIIQPALPTSMTGVPTATGSASPDSAISSIMVDATVNAVAPASISVLIDGTYTTTASAAQDNSSVSSSLAVIPGQKLQVLPIGLGIFGGLAGLTIVIVGYAMYERRKYKKQFIRRKALEQGSLAGLGEPMSGGYGSA